VITVRRQHAEKTVRQWRARRRRSHWRIEVVEEGDEATGVGLKPLEKKTKPPEKD